MTLSHHSVTQLYDSLRASINSLLKRCHYFSMWLLLCWVHGRMQFKRGIETNTNSMLYE